MNLNIFAQGTDPLDMTTSDEFRSLLTSAGELGIEHDPAIPYRSANIVLRGHRFHFLEWGRPNAPTVILLHGGHQQAHSWDLASLHLARDYRVLALDQRGHGDTEWARDVDYSGAAMAQDAAAFIRAVGGGSPIVVGHSMGGRNGMLLARDHPGLMKALVLVDIGPEIADAGRAQIAGFVAANNEFDNLEHFIENVRKYDPYRPREHIERTVKYNMFERMDGKYISKCDATPRRLGLRPGQRPGDNVTLDDCAKFNLPVLVVRGETSNILAPDAAMRLRDALPHGELVTVEKAGHGVPSQNTRGFLAALVPFLEKVTA
ncbi:MAG: alpha/beta hydrolase [Acetobacteraceae bacterium]|nr:alpha/beta hydrolase [Acetobacteraceae bacterium]